MPNEFTLFTGTDRLTLGQSLFVLCLAVFLGGSSLGGPMIASAQTVPSEGETLIDRYQTARRHVLAQRFLQQGRDLRVLSPKTLPTAVDSLRRTPEENERQDETRPFPLENVHTVHRLERGWFDEQYGDTRWSFLGAGTYQTFFDTTRTQELRARLQGHFGDPTQTLGDADPREVEDGRAQFEYWFVVNDSIPVRVTDASGPLDRGLIVMTDRQYRDRILALRDTLLGVLRQPKRAPYADYYYDTLAERWYRTGYTGESYFLERISPYDILPGRRARTDTDGDEPSSSTSEAGSSPSF